MESSACRRSASDANQSVWSCSMTVKEEPEWGECGASEAAAAEGLYAGQNVKDELVIGPDVVQQQDIVFSMQNALSKTEPCKPKQEDRSYCNRSTEQQYNLRSSNLTKHTREHTDESPHSGDTCNKQFTRKRNRTAHKRLHTGERSYGSRKINMGSNNYTPDTLKQALDEINNRKMSVYKASKTYKIPSQTLYDKVHVKYKKQTHRGATTVLTQNEEGLIVDWIVMMDETGFSVTKDMIIHSVQKFVSNLDRANKFKDGLPGRHWYAGFLKRNPMISQRVSQTLVTLRVVATEEDIRTWFLRVQEYFEENNLLEVLENPSRIFNCDESVFSQCPKGQALLTRTDTKTVNSKSKNDDKECLTLLLGASADGKLMPLLALVPYNEIPGGILAKYPKDWSVSRSDNGWMTCDTFYDYITNVFNPFLEKENIRKPVVMFLDGQVSHLSLHLSEFCKENGIVLMALLPSSTHDLQPLDAAIFHSLKNAWSRDIYEWRMENIGCRLKIEDFGPVLDNTIKKTLKPETIKNGFRKCGLYPFNENAVDYGRLIENSATPSSTNTGTMPLTTQEYKKFITQFENHLGTTKLCDFEQCAGEWNGDIKDENLYYFWKNIKETCPDYCPSTTSDPSETQIGDSIIDANNSTLPSLNLTDWPTDILVLDNGNTCSTLNPSNNNAQNVEQGPNKPFTTDSNIEESHNTVTASENDHMIHSDTNETSNNVRLEPEKTNSNHEKSFNIISSSEEVPKRPPEVNETIIQVTVENEPNNLDVAYAPELISCIMTEPI